MNGTTKDLGAALHRLFEDKGRAEAARFLVANRISPSAAEKLLRGKYKIVYGSIVYTRLRAALKPYMGE